MVDIVGHLKYRRIREVDQHASISKILPFDLVVIFITFDMCLFSVVLFSYIAAIGIKFLWYHALTGPSSFHAS